MKITLLHVMLLFFIYFQINALTCGGNCPAGNCPDCPCGSTKSIADSTWITNECGNVFYGDTKCCKCIISASSSGNKAFMTYDQQKISYQVGLFALDGKLVWERCQITTEKVCQGGQPNIVCAKMIYMQDQNSWRNFPAAKKCGCFSEEQIKKELQ